MFGGLVFGRGAPQRDLLLSPDHAGYAVILAEGLPVESYLDTGDRSAFETGDGPTMLHPAFGSERADTALVAEALSYAPLRVTGAEVAAVKARLADRATRSESDCFDEMSIRCLARA